MKSDTHFTPPITGRFNIDYPFDKLFEVEIKQAQNVGEILSIISAAFHQVYDSQHEYDLQYMHGIDDLVFENGIRVYDNGTIEFEVGS